MSAQTQYNIGICRTQRIPDFLTICRRYIQVTGILQCAVPVHKRMGSQDHILVRVRFDDVICPLQCPCRRIVAKGEDQVISAAFAHLPAMLIQLIILIGIHKPRLIGINIIIINIVKGSRIVMVTAHGHPCYACIIQNICRFFEGVPLGICIIVYHVPQMHHSLNVIFFLIICDPLCQFFENTGVFFRQELCVGQCNHGIVACCKIGVEPVYKGCHIVFPACQILVYALCQCVKFPACQQAVAGGRNAAVFFQRIEVPFDVFCSTHIRPDADIGDLAFEILAVVACICRHTACTAVVAADFQCLCRNNRFKVTILYDGNQFPIDIAAYDIFLIIKCHGYMYPVILTQVNAGDYYTLFAAIGLIAAALLPIQSGLTIFRNFKVYIAQVIIIIAQFCIVPNDNTRTAFQILWYFDRCFEGTRYIAQHFRCTQLIRTIFKICTAQVQLCGNILIIKACINGSICFYSICFKIPRCCAGCILEPACKAAVASFQCYIGFCYFCVHFLGSGIQFGSIPCYRCACNIEFYCIFCVGVIGIPNCLYCKTACFHFIRKYGVGINLLAAFFAARRSKAPCVSQTVFIAFYGFIIVFCNFCIGADIAPHTHFVDLAIEVNGSCMIVTAEAQPVVQFRSFEIVCVFHRYCLHQLTVYVCTQFILCRITHNGYQHPFASFDGNIIKYRAV